MVAVSAKLDGLLLGNIYNENVKFIPNYNLKKGSYRTCILSGKNVLCPPMEGNEILIYDFEKKITKSIELPANKYSCQINKLYSGVAHENKRYYFPGQYPYIVVENCNREFELYPVDMNKLDSKNNIFVENIISIDGLIVLASFGNNTLCTFGLENNQLTYHELPKEIGACRALAFSKPYMFLSDDSGKIWSINIDTREYSLVYERNGIVYRRCVYWDGMFVFFPENDTDIIMIEPIHMEINKIKHPELRKNNAGYGNINIYDRWLTIFNNETQEMLFFDKDMNIVKKMKYYIAKAECKYDLGKDFYAVETVGNPASNLSNYLRSILNYKKE
jgi:hypothetical protein